MAKYTRCMHLTFHSSHALVTRECPPRDHEHVTMCLGKHSYAPVPSNGIGGGSRQRAQHCEWLNDVGAGAFAESQAAGRLLHGPGVVLAGAPPRQVLDTCRHPKCCDSPCAFDPRTARVFPTSGYNYKNKA